MDLALVEGENNRGRPATAFERNSVSDQETGEQAMSVNSISNRSEAKMSKSRVTNVVPSAAPLTGQHAHEIQAFGSVVAMPLALAEKTRRASAADLNQILADTITLRDFYKKHHWQVSGPTFYQLHMLVDKHFNEQYELVDRIA